MAADDNSESGGHTTKAGRNIKFTFDENCALVDKVVQYYDHIYGHLAPKTSQARKRALWLRICEAVNAVGAHPRTIDNCKKRVSDIKRLLKKKLAEEKKYARGTGGGAPHEIHYLEYEEDFKKVMGPDIVDGIDGHIDTDDSAVSSRSVVTGNHENPTQMLNSTQGTCSSATTGGPSDIDDTDLSNQHDASEDNILYSSDFPDVPNDDAGSTVTLVLEPVLQSEGDHMDNPGRTYPNTSENNDRGEISDLLFLSKVVENFSTNTNAVRKLELRKIKKMNKVEAHLKMLNQHVLEIRNQQRADSQRTKQYRSRKLFLMQENNKILHKILQEPKQVNHCNPTTEAVSAAALSSQKYNTRNGRNKTDSNAAKITSEKVFTKKRKK
ncbi:uncharacterized protein LOC121394761 isoform X1 [Xenopus laevis]|uniref:Uncharacterized protein LOC121394761 isoform X1 n=1 Tax=Xenopus laevis TaxID=8355 RepID=A0A8J1L1Q9_XENLA|nr:uncharacterized protein LOC121394761 isoform X1 [Xenopus laevis]